MGYPMDIKRKKNIWQSWLSLKPWQKIIFALFTGIAAGFLLGHKAIYLKPIGSLFINAIHMMIVPVVFTAIVCAVISMHDPQKMRRIGIKTIVLYACSMAVAASIGLLVATVIAPGSGLHSMAANATLSPAGALPTFTDAIINMVPANPVGAFANGNILQILVFAVVLGVAMNLAGAAAQPVVNFFRACSAVVFKLTGIVMSFAPYGIFALMAWVTGEYGLQALIPLMKLVGTVYLCCGLLMLFFYVATLLIFARLNPVRFFKGIVNAMLLAFTTSSSAATLPVTIKCAEENLGVSKSIAGFLLPLGTTLNLNGLSIYLGVATVFAANMYGIHLNFAQYLTIVFSIILTSMGAGGVPGSAIIVMSAVMSSVGLPLGAIPLIAGVDRLNDMAQTTTNVTGDLYAALMVAKSENELDETIYNNGPEKIFSGANVISVVVPEQVDAA